MSNDNNNNATTLIINVASSQDGTLVTFLEWGSRRDGHGDWVDDPEVAKVWVEGTSMEGRPKARWEVWRRGRVAHPDGYLVPGDWVQTQVGHWNIAW